MGKSVKYLSPLIAFGALVALLFAGLARDPSAIPSTMIDKPTPEFTRPNLLDPAEMVTHEALRGRITLVNVWGTWCVSCRQEHPELVRLASKEDVKIVGFNWRDDRALAAQYLEHYGNPYVVNAMVGDTDPLIVNWGVVGAPETFFIDREGTIRYKHTGPITNAVWEGQLREIYERLEAEG
jgi:cytochrome c biogenesis protein CcmG/thiol:disulfide interchange protein DsbE